MPFKGEAKRRDDAVRAKKRLAAHRAAKAAGVPGTPSKPHAAKLNTFGATPTDLLAPEVLDHVRAAAASSAPPILIARSLGMTLPAFKKFADENPAFQEALDIGHAEEGLWATNNLRNIAGSDSRHAVLANLAILNSRHGWRGENKQAPQVVINLPAPASPEQYARLIEHEQSLLPAPDEDSK